MHKLTATLSAAFLLGSFTAIPAVSLNAQTSTENHLEYAYGHSIEASAGCALTCNSNGYIPGPDFNLRYTWFWGKHFGVYGHIGGSVHAKHLNSMFNELDPSYDYYTVGLKKRIWDAYLGITVGLAYRLDFGSWSFRPRAGIGYGEYGPEDYRYYRFPASSSGIAPELISVERASMKPGSIKGVCFDASIQVTYSPANHFFIFAEIGGRALPGSIIMNEIIYETEVTSADNVLEALITPKYSVTNEKGRTEKRHIIGGTASLRFGIGWNIGFNRNTCKKQ